MNNGADGWNATDIPELAGRVAVVTGSNSGIGYCIARELADKGANVVMACRSMERGEAALRQLRSENPERNVELIPCDLGNLASVEQFADSFKANHNTLDMLVNNAGIMMPPFGLTSDGIEQQIGINHMGHFALTGHLFPLLKATDGARIINTSSVAHRQGTTNFDDINYERSYYFTYTAYGRSKLAALLFTHGLAQGIQANKLRMRALTVHPGTSGTNLTHSMGVPFFRAIFQGFLTNFGQVPDQAALPALRAATDPTARNGQYYGPGGLFEFKGNPVVVKARPIAYDTLHITRLWQASEQLTGVTFDFSN